MKAKIIKSYPGYIGCDDYEITKICDITDWEEISEQDYSFLVANICSLDDYHNKHYVLKEENLKETIANLKNAVGRKVKEREEAEKKKKIAKEKRLMTMDEKKKQRELKKLEELKKKYEGDN